LLRNNNFLITLHWQYSFSRECEIRIRKPDIWILEPFNFRTNWRPVC
jgi:hypothetical protein